MGPSACKVPTLQECPSSSGNGLRACPRSARHAVLDDTPPDLRFASKVWQVGTPKPFCAPGKDIVSPSIGPSSGRWCSSTLAGLPPAIPAYASLPFAADEPDPDLLEPLIALGVLTAFLFPKLSEADGEAIENEDDSFSYLSPVVILQRLKGW